MTGDDETEADPELDAEWRQPQACGYFPKWIRNVIWISVFIGPWVIGYLILRG